MICGWFKRELGEQINESYLGWFKCHHLINGNFMVLKMEVLYHIRPYYVGIFPYIDLIYIYGRYLQSIGSWNGQWSNHLESNSSMVLPERFIFQCIFWGSDSPIALHRAQVDDARLHRFEAHPRQGWPGFRDDGWSSQLSGWQTKKQTRVP
jgi:hypothetical protein